MVFLPRTTKILDSSNRQSFNSFFTTSFFTTMGMIIAQKSWQQRAESSPELPQCVSPPWPVSLPSTVLYIENHIVLLCQVDSSIMSVDALKKSSPTGPDKFKSVGSLA